MKIVVTGSAGFIGYHLTKSLLKDGYEVLGIDNINNYYDQKLKIARIELLKSYKNFIFHKIDIADLANLAKSFNFFYPNKVVNLAAQPGVRNSHISSNNYVHSNLLGFVNLIELSVKFDVKGFIYASSSSVYGNDDVIASSESDSVDKPISLYGATKRANELIAHSYSHSYNLNTTGLRYFTVYGPWYRPDMAIFIFINNIFSGESIPVFNNGNMSRDFTYIDDVVRGTRSAITDNYKCEIFNLGNNKSEKILDIINLIENEVDLKAKIDFQPMQVGEQKTSCANIKYSQKKIGYKPTTLVKTGIPKVIKWYKEYYNV